MRAHPADPGQTGRGAARFMLSQDAPGLRAVHAYPPSVLYLTMAGVCVPVTYQSEWHDGFGARGWKLDVAIADPCIIASTRETGGRIPTSVLIHDLLDHLLSGFAVSGHRAEAMALIQLGERTGSDIRQDYLQMVNEDLRYGQVNGESLASFLPVDLLAKVPQEKTGSGPELVATLREQFGDKGLTERLVQWFFELGKQGRHHAQDSWRLLGLDDSRRHHIGLALQRLLGQVDEMLEHMMPEQLHATFVVGNEICALEIPDAAHTALADRYTSKVL